MPYQKFKLQLQDSNPQPLSSQTNTQPLNLSHNWITSCKYIPHHTHQKKKNDENYYLQVFLKDCKYIERKKTRHINDNLTDFSSCDEYGEKYISMK